MQQTLNQSVKLKKPQKKRENKSQLSEIKFDVIDD